MTAVIYARYSSDNQREESIEGQIRECTAYAEKNGITIGELKFRDVVVPDAIPPIVPLELFEDVQEKIAKNKKAPARRKAEDDYLLTTKLHCGILYNRKIQYPPFEEN